ncbi:DNA oxidative demethylase AlkB [Comamonas testosteroni]|uniref:Alpha-ketoglutarate-dependent dioxygenase AlkB n=1 Tax=Comamonas testosteroni TaxID=285 RepID=A0A8B4RXX0_COMTE|nr:DNA oxidative demethylase AlkB [Comamonas testosteroni]EHN67470.1 alpha-ketoglutarate-dependent dioxygenase AlkB [Comamonas testosteroni ATCC 11996]QQN70899.1 DNA oxidative demethylase AlkB [Comamonas testosteroni]SUY73858.1 Alpha-ketoglutarate-dependent dioxygenase AlkB [Comamonas testosteroni]
MTLSLFPDEPLPAEIIDDGAVLLRGFAAAQEQRWVADVTALQTRAAFRNMQVPGGKFMSVAITNAGGWGWISDLQGYRYSAVDPQTGKPWPAIPAFLCEQAARAAALAGYPDFAPDACLINRYQPGARMGLHRDQDEHDYAAPIVSVSLGLACSFLWGGLTRQSPTRRLALTHGDVLVWGGRSRLVFHGVAPLKQGQHPLLGNERWNLTFRMAKARYPAGQPSE